MSILPASQARDFAAGFLPLLSANEMSFLPRRGRASRAARSACTGSYRRAKPPRRPGWLVDHPPTPLFIRNFSDSLISLLIIIINVIARRLGASYFLRHK